jgi:hypothetical protein
MAGTSINHYQATTIKQRAQTPQTQISNIACDFNDLIVQALGTIVQALYAEAEVVITKTRLRDQSRETPSKKPQKGGERACSNRNPAAGWRTWLAPLSRCEGGAVVGIPPGTGW